MDVIIDDTALDTITVKFWRDGGYNGKTVPDRAPWMCHIGENFIEGACGSGATKGEAFADMIRNIQESRGNVITDCGEAISS